MKAQLVRHTPQRVSWSYSKIKNWRSCPKRHYHVDLKKDFKEPEGEALKYGNMVHQALEDRIMKGVPIPPAHAPHLEPWANKVLKGYADAARYFAGTGQTVLGEQQLAIREDFSPCEWFAKDTWHRSKIDLIMLNGPVAVAVDWKTGKVLDDSEQLMIAAQCIFSHWPEIQIIRTKFVWLKEDAETVLDVGRKDMPGLWATLLPEIQRYTEAVRTTDFPAQPSGLCKRYCPVTSCPYNGANQ